MHEVISEMENKITTRLPLHHHLGWLQFFFLGGLQFLKWEITSVGEDVESFQPSDTAGAV